MQNISLSHAFARLLTATALLVTGVESHAYSFESSGIYYEIQSDATVAVTYKDVNNYKYGTYSGNVVIPASVSYDGKSYAVTAIGDKAFYLSKELVSVEIPNTVSTIGETAFGYCSRLLSVTLPYGIKEIADNTFMDCGITSIDIPSSVEKIGNQAFVGCANLRNITIPASVKEIGDRAISSCQNLTYVDVPKSVTSIGEYAFAYNKNLGSVYFAEDVSPLTLGRGVFSECSGMTYIHLPQNLVSLGEEAFSKCVSLSEVSLPYGLTRIEPRTFENCSSLYMVEIPNSVTSIGYFAFNGCLALRYSSYNYGKPKFSIPSSVTSIESSAFSGCTSLTSIEIPESVTSIGLGAFSNCSSLTSITLPDITCIDMSTFYYCTSLKDIAIPTTCETIEQGAFSYCRNLTSIVIPESVKTVDYRAFAGCSDLKTVFCHAVEPPSCGNYDRAWDNSGANMKLYVPKSSVDAYKAAKGWNDYFTILPMDGARSLLVKLPGGNILLPEHTEGQKLGIMSDDGFQFHSATLENEDVSHLVGEDGYFAMPEVDKPTVLNVVFKQTSNPETEINAVGLDDEVRVTVYGKRVCIAGKSADTIVRAYDMRGVLIEETTESEFCLDYGGVVILRVGSDTFRFAI